MVEDADEEIAALSSFNPEQTAIVDKQFSDALQGFSSPENPSGSIELVDYQPNQLRYESQSPQKQLAVFSEIYYPKGWKAYIDGAPAEHFRVNYVLRAMVIPKGDHTIEFKFEPNSYYTGETIALITSILVILIVLGGLGYEVKRNYFENEKQA